MKQKLTFFIVLLMSLAIPQNVKAAHFSAVAPSGQILYYSYNNGVGGNSVYVTYPGTASTTWSGYTQPTGALVIPDSVIYDGNIYYVTSIGLYAFNGCDGLTSITLPSTISRIQGYAFSYCRGLTSITIPNTVSFIGTEAFKGCQSLISITIPNAVTIISNGTFKNCSSLTSINISGAVTSIGDFAFSGCTSLVSFTIPNSVTSINASTFVNCTNLTSIVIHNAITSIGYDAFYGCSRLASVVIGNSVTSIGAYAFSCCSGLTSITCMASIPPTIGTNTFQDVPATTPVNVPCGCASSYSWSWGHFSNYVEPAVSIITVNTSDSTIGRVIISTQPTCHDSTAVIRAIPNCGYGFHSWNDGNTDNPRSILMTQDTSFTAYFDSVPPDSIVIRNTVYIHDTVFINADIYDTTYIHDTTYVGTKGIGTVMINAKIYAQQGQIVVEGHGTEPVLLYNSVGRLLATRRSEDIREGIPLRFDVPVSGTYHVCIGNASPSEVMVLK